jgi:serine/threonine-protein kinase
MEDSRQPVATHGNGFRLFLRVLDLPDLRPVATGCSHGLHKGSILCCQQRRPPLWGTLRAAEAGRFERLEADAVPREDDRAMFSAVTIGASVGGFRLDESLGEGAMGCVYRATRAADGREAAVKILSPALARDERFRQRFLRESRLAAALDHPHVVPILSAGEDDGVLYLAMERVHGSDLRTLLRSGGAIEPRRALRLLRQAAEALDAAHSHGLVHRDVKPANLLITPEDGVYVCDFGLARHVSTASSLTSDRGLIGTIDYIPPEQIEGGSVDGRADVYSLGCVLFECLTESAPFERESDLAVVFAHLNEPAPRISELRNDLPRSLDDVVATALVKSPSERFTTCRELIDAAEGALDGRRQASGKVRRRVVAVVAAAVAAVGGGAAGAILLATTGRAAAAITPTSIAGAKLGLRAVDYEKLFGPPWTFTRLAESEHVKLTFPKRQIAVYFKGLTDTAVEITTWNPKYHTATGISPCMSLKDLHHAYGRRLKPSEFNTQHGVVYALKLGKTLLFASNEQLNVETIALYYGDAPDALKPGGALSFAGYIALSQEACY